MTAAFTGPYALMSSLASAIGSDAGVISAIQTLYPPISPITALTTLSFFVGVDANEMPPVSAAPYIAMMPGDYSRMAGDEGKNIGVRIALVIANGTTTLTGKTLTMSGFNDLEKLVHLVNDVIRTLFLFKFGRFISWGSIQTDVFFPEFRATWTVDAKDEIT